MKHMIHKLFIRERYPSFPEEWDNPENTVFREFYLHAGDYGVLLHLVKTHMSDKGNTGVDRCRLMNILRYSEAREFFLLARKRKYPHTWLIRWRFRRLRETIHRRLKTARFRKTVLLCKIAKDVADDILNHHQTLHN